MFKYSRYIVVLFFLVAIGMVQGLVQAEEESRSEKVLAVFTDSIREVYLEGELIEVNVVIKGAEPGKLILQMEEVDENDKSISGDIIGLVKEEIDSSKSETITYRLETILLKPARYKFWAKLGEMESNKLSLEIISQVKLTHMVKFSDTDDIGAGMLGTNLMSHYAWGTYYWIPSYPFYGNIDRNTRILKSNYMNLLIDAHEQFQTHSYPPHAHLDKYFKRHPGLRKDAAYGKVMKDYKRKLRRTPGLIEELKYIPSLYDVWLQECLRNGISWMREPNFYWDHPEFVDKGWADIKMRDMLYFTQAMRKYPSFLGFSYTGFEFGFGSVSLHEKIFEEKYKCRRPTKKEIHTYNRTRKHLPDFKDEDLKKRQLLWHKYQTGLFSKVYGQYREALEEVYPGIVTTANHSDTINNYGLGGLLGKAYPKNAFDECTTILTTFQTDHGSLPFVEALNANLFKAGSNKPYWSTARTQGHTLSAYRQRALLSLGMGIQGIGPGWWASMREEFNETGGPIREGIRDFYKLATIYGDLFSGLKPAKEAAVLLSYTQQAFTPQVKSVAGCMAHLLRTGYQANIITEEEILKGELSEYKALILVGITEYDQKVMRKIKNFIQKGGIVIKDMQSRPEVPGKVIKLSFGYPRQIDQSTEFRLLYRRAKVKVPELKKVLGKYVDKFVGSQNIRVLLRVLEGGKGRYLFVVNDVLHPWAHPQYAFMPHKEKLYFKDRNYAIYNLMKQKLVSPEQSKDGYSIVAEMDRIEGEIFAFLPEEIKGVKVGISQETRQGELIKMEVNILDSNGEVIDALIPIEVTILDSNGKDRYHLYRASDRDGYVDYLKIALNDQPGKWKIKVTELLSGLESTVDFKVVDKENKIKVKKQKDVIICDQEAIAKLLKEKRPLTIALDNSQSAWVRELADELKTRLSKEGIPCQIKDIDEIVENRKLLQDALTTGKGSNVRYGGDWCERTLPHYTIKEDLILMGSENNRLIKAVFGAHIPLRRFSEHYPGQGKGLIEYLWSPFYPYKDAVLILSRDEAGLRKAVNTLVKIKSIREGGRLVVEPYLSRAAKVADLSKKYDVNLYKESISVSQSEMKVNTGKHGAGKEFEMGGPGTYAPLLDSSDGRYTLTGIDSYGYNLFLVDNEKGEILWKQKVGLSSLKAVSISEDGQEILATSVPQSLKYRGKPRNGYTMVLDGRGKPIGRYNEYQGSITNGKVRIIAGKTAIKILKEGRIIVSHDIRSKEEIEKKKNRQIQDLSLSRSGRYLFIGTGLGGRVDKGRKTNYNAESKIILLDTEDGNVLWEKALSKKSGYVESLYITTNEDYFGVATRRGFIFIYDQKGEPFLEVKVPPNPVGILRDNQKWSGSERFRSHLSFRLTDQGDFLVATSGEGKVYAFDGKGNELWDTEVSEFEYMVNLSLDQKTGHIGVGTWDNSVHVLDREGNILWKKKVGPGQRVMFSKDGEEFLVGTWGGKLYSFDTKGNKRWEIDFIPQTYIEDLPSLLKEQRSIPLLSMQAKLEPEYILVSEPTNEAGIRLEVNNGGREELIARINAQVMDEGWKIEPDKLEIKILSQGSKSIDWKIKIPANSRAGPHKIVIDLNIPGQEERFTSIIDIPGQAREAEEGSIKIDGDLKEWDLSSPMIIDREEQVYCLRKGMKWEGKEDLSAQVYAAYDKDNLYIGSQVKDNLLMRNKEKEWEGTNFEIYFDLNERAQRRKPFYNATVYQFVVLPGTDEDPKALFTERYTHAGAEYRYEGADVASRRTEYGYDLEIKIPFKNFPQIAEKGLDDIGFDIGINKSDGQHHRKLQMVWAGTEENYQKTQDFGTLVFSGKKSEKRSAMESVVKERIAPLRFNSASFIDGGISDKAIAEFEKIAQNPDDRTGYFDIGYAYLLQGKPDKAIIALKKAQEIAPYDKEIYNNHGVAYQKMGQYNKAEVYFKKALEIDKDYSDAGYNLANTHFLKGEYKKAIELYEEILAQAPEDIYTLKYLALSYEKIRDKDKAIKIWEKIQDKAILEAEEENLFKEAGDHIKRLKGGER